MKILVLTAIAGTTLIGGKALTTKYTAERALKVALESSLTLETTTQETEVDGEPVTGRGGPGGGKTEMTRAEVHVDRVIEAADGKPAKIRRTFEKVGGSMSFSMGDQSRDIDLESPFQGITVELERGKDGISSSVVDGKAPDDEKALDGQQLELFLDGLLPKGEVDVDGTWDIEKDAIARALRLDVQRNMYPPPERPADSGGGGGGGGRRGGPGGGGGMGAGPFSAAADWKGTAKLTSLDKEVDGVKCAVVELKLEAAGERELPAMGGGRGPRPKKDMFEMPSALGNTETYSITLEGKLYVDMKDHHPVKLELEGKVKDETRTESTRNDKVQKRHTVREGKVTYKVEISDAPAEKTEKKTAKSDK